MSVTVFWGCQIPAQLPFLEKTARNLFSLLGLDYRDLEETTCCPEKLIVAEKAPFHHLLTAARNLALAEREGADIVTLCNGCYSTLATTQRRVKCDPILQQRVNERLASIGLSLEGKFAVRNIIEAIDHDVGIGQLRKRLKRPLTGLRVAVHYGCNLLRPLDLLQFDDPFAPESVDRLVTALGGMSVDYPTKLDCCGGNFTLLDAPDRCRDMLASKLKGVMSAKPDLLLVSCPSCFTQFDVRQERLAREQGFAPVPVLHIVELVHYALAAELDEAALKRHRVKLDPVFEKLASEKRRREALAGMLDVPLLDACAACGACDEDCPVCRSDPSYSANAIVKLVAEGRIAEAMEMGAQWRCLDCLACEALCPNHFGMVAVFRALRKLSLEGGVSPETLAKAHEAFVSSGLVAQTASGLRKRLDLPDVPTADPEELKRLLSEDPPVSS
ncbi:MAG: heterodisulfide reductase-related iron-sulfur binding cluster [Planctomycetota bacterium]